MKSVITLPCNVGDRKLYRSGSVSSIASTVFMRVPCVHLASFRMLFVKGHISQPVNGCGRPFPMPLGALPVNERSQSHPTPSGLWKPPSSLRASPILWGQIFCRADWGHSTNPEVKSSWNAFLFKEKYKWRFQYFLPTSQRINCLCVYLNLHIYENKVDKKIPFF